MVVVVPSNLSLCTPGYLHCNLQAICSPSDSVCCTDDGAEKEPTQKVELKGDDKTDIQFSGKTTFRFMVDGKWTDGTLGALTVRKDKASGTSWIQVNNESKVCLLSSLLLLFVHSAVVVCMHACILSSCELSETEHVLACALSCAKTVTHVLVLVVYL